MSALGARFVRVVCCAVGTAVLLLTASGCGSSRDYAVPDSVCGVPAASQALSPLLPDGKKLVQDHYASEPPERRRCRVYVDHTLVVWLAGDITDASTDPLKVNEENLLREGHPARVDIADRATLADSGAIAVARCTFKGKPHNFAVEVQLGTDYPKKPEERRKALLKFFRAYVPAAVKKQGC